MVSGARESLRSDLRMKNEKEPGRDGDVTNVIGDEAAFRLRTLLNTIVLASHVLGAAHVTPEQLEENLTAIEQSCAGVAKIIGEIRRGTTSSAGTEGRRP